jgi:hypothetical protein
MSSTLRPNVHFFKDSSSSDDSGTEELIDDDIKQMVVMLFVKELEDRKTNKRRGSKVGQLCIP